jgi:malonate transporter
MANIKEVLKRLLRNPLITAIFSGFLISLAGVKVPEPISTFLHMLGKTAATIAIFMLGMFLYGRTYRNLPRAPG